MSSLLGRLVGTAATVATAPVTLTMACATTAATVAKEIFGGTPPRRRWQSDGRCWIEIRGLDGEYGSALADTLVETVRAQPGVSWARVNHAVSRLIVAVEATGPSIDELCQIVADVEADVPGDGKRLRPTDLPGDGVVLAGRALSTAANGLGLCAATAGRLMMWPSLPTGLTGVVTAIDYQPRLRAFVEQRLGDTAADTVLGLAAASVYTVTQSPSSLAVEFFRHLSQVGELLASARTWDLHEPALAEQAAADHLETPERPCPMPPGPVERHAARSGVIQGVAGPVVGLLTGNLNTAGTAAVVAAPKAARNARESFAATLGRGLADRHDVLTLRPDGLRRLDRIDVVVVDPRVLLTEELRVSQLRDVPDQARGELWQWAGDEVRRGALHAGWHRRGRARGQVLVRHAHHGLAAAVLGEIRRADAEVVSVASDELDELRSSFDELYPVDGSVDAALLEAVQALQADGHTVAVVSSAAPQALSAADLSIGVLNRTAPWRADLLAPDLAAVWRIMHALSAAQKASRRGVELATSASMLAALLMVPGVRGVGPGPVTAGAGAGLLVGMQLARGVLGAPAPQPAPVQDWHAMSVEQTRQALPAPDREPARARSRLAAPVGLATRIVGPTLGLAGEMAGAVRTELSDPLTPVLAVGAAASALLGSPVDAVLVGSVLTGNAVLAAGQQVRAERLLRRLLAVQDPPARLVVDDGDDSVEAAQLRAGDLIEVRPGEVIPADCRIVDADDVEIDESALTGESLPVFKQVEATPGAIVAERSCMLYAGTTVVSGIARAVVTAVGAQTQVRRAAEAAPTHGSTVGLQTQLRDLTNRALPFSLAGGALVSGLGVLRLTPLRQAVASGVAVAVAAVPEGLPLVATLAQQASARRLTRSGALVRTPKAVEALGRVDVVCFDKTGTLSENRLRVSHVEAAGGTEKQVLDIAARATQPRNGDNHEHATDAAVIEAANTESPRAVDVEAHLPFRSGRPYSATLSGSELFIKGAPEVVLAASGNPARSVEKAVHRMAESGLRVIAVAHRRVTAEEVAAARADDAAFAELCSHGLEMAGLLGLSDTPRAESAGLLAALQDQGIGVRLITGDHPVTATAIAIELGLPVSAAQVISGSEWEAMSRRSQEKAVQDRVVFARMTPEHKVQVVQTLERTGLVCAMVGDGANDAAAIRAATVGIGVASRGSDPARTAADVMLLDGRIGALLDALEEGRQLWRRVQAAVSVLLGGNAGEVAFAIVGSALTGRSPLNARQLLLVNMMTDALPAAALAVSPSIGNGDHAVRGPDRSALWRTVAIRGTTTAAAATTAWLLAGFTLQPRRASTVALVALVSTQLGQTLIDSHSPLVVSTAAGSLATLGVLISTPGVSQLLGCTPLGPLGWAQALGTAGVATTAALVAPRVLSRVQSSMSTTPSRHSAAYSSRNGTAMKRATTDTGSDEPLASDEDTPSTVLTAGV